MRRHWFFIPLLLGLPLSAIAQSCDTTGVRVQVLGSGGPELSARRAGTSYLVWIEGKARVLIDAGYGAARNLAASGATAVDFDVMLLSQVRTDHAVDLVPVLEWSLGKGRDRALPLYGPTGNRTSPATVTFVRDLLDGDRGAWRHLGKLIHPLTKTGFRLEPHDVRDRPPAKLGVARKNDDDPVIRVFANERVRISAVSVPHTDTPTLAWRIDIGKKSIVFASDNGGSATGFAALASGADLLVAHLPIPEGSAAAKSGGLATPSAIGQMAKSTAARQLVLSHRGTTTLGREDDTTAKIRAHFAGPVYFADDFDCFTP